MNIFDLKDEGDEWTLFWSCGWKGRLFNKKQEKLYFDYRSFLAGIVFVCALYDIGCLFMVLLAEYF